MTNNTEVRNYRLTSIDCMRGIVMILMALDHVRAYFSYSTHDPTAPFPLFATRWITHLCAPAFILLAGVSIGLMARYRSLINLTQFLVTRGIWLIFLEMTVITFAWKFNYINEPIGIIFQVIWALGVAMIVMAILIHLPKIVVGFIALTLVSSGGILDIIMPTSSFSQTYPLWMSIHRQIVWELGNYIVIVIYPTLSWIGVMAFGYLLADIYKQPQQQRQYSLLKMGIGLLIFFFLFRFFNIYGDPTPWRPGETIMRTIINFINVDKYSPSLLYLSITLGINFLLLAFLEKYKFFCYTAMVTIGRVPLFYYVLHIYLIHLAALCTGMIMGFPASSLLVHATAIPADFGFSLPVVYLVWLIIILALYPACKWFADIKAKRKNWWLSYL
ncbi:DUF1624 domain-containing protein [Spartinivicinus ruber]|uniref:DUF1624 domain-containing protein n=1 Tax=Spartinivicinus ruber TaxID=2683272 RepID=UPI0013D3B83C|nr:heparan-alpha-glucosaminide N-acetyltransferase domain-containing protein [Spartinivicinus ruber]